jgi:guanylate kinase
MRITGGVIYITGLLGAGKTTLINAALDNILELRHMPEYITRPLRSYELDPKYEIVHVTHIEYRRLRRASKMWDHTEILGNWYGTDAERIKLDLCSGQWFIISSPIEIEKLEAMKSIYNEHGKSLTIWVDTGLETANRRLLERDGDNAKTRINDHTQSNELADKARYHAGIIFNPTNDLELDKVNFVNLIREIMNLSATVQMPDTL